MTIPNLGERIAETENAAKVLQLTLDDQLREGLEDVFITIVRLDTDETIGLKVSNGSITDIGGEKIAKIPNLDVLKSSDAFLAHLRATTKLQIRGLESTNF